MNERLSFFEDLYTGEKKVRPHLDDLHFKTLMHKAKMMEIGFTVDEIKEASFSLRGEGATGPDGFLKFSFTNFGIS